MKTVKIKLYNKEKLQFELEEDAHRGDIVAILDTAQVDLTIIREQFVLEEEKLSLALRQQIENDIIEQTKNSIYASHEYKNLESAQNKLEDLKIDFENKIKNKEVALRNQWVSENAAKNNQLNAEITTLKQQAISNIANAIAAKTNELRGELLNKDTQLNKAYSNYQNELAKAKNNLHNQQLKEDELKNELMKQNNERTNKLNAEISTLKTQEAAKITNAIARETNILRNQLLDQKTQLIKSEQNYQNKLVEATKIIKEKLLDEAHQEIEKNIETKYQLLFADKNERITKLQSAYDTLERNKASLNTKALGEELESWIQNQYNNYSLLFAEECAFSKTNVAKSGTKPDFLFTVNNESGINITKVIIEAKTESQFSKESNKRKNSSHFDKLWKDQKNFQADYSILVSELETTDNNFLIQKVNSNKYTNMFVVRPKCLIPLLALIRDFALKRSTIAKIDIELKEKQTILSEFDLFKEQLIKDFCDKIQKNVSTIKNQADKIKTSATMIETKANDILENIILSITTKINKYKIDKKVKSLKNFEK